MANVNQKKNRKEKKNNNSKNNQIENVGVAEKKQDGKKSTLKTDGNPKGNHDKTGETGKAVDTGKIDDTGKAVDTGKTGDTGKAGDAGKTGRPGKKKIWLIGGIAVAGVAALYCAISVFFMGHYFVGTVIGDIPCGGKSPKAVEKQIVERARDYTLQLHGREGTEAVLTASEIGLEFLLDDSLAQVAKEQVGYKWISFLWRQDQFDMPVKVKYEEALLDQKLEEMALFDRKNAKKPVNAYIGEYDKQTKSYPIVPQEDGTLIDREKGREAVIHAIEAMEENLDLDEADCYEEPRIPSDDEDLVKFDNRLNRFVSARVEYDWHGSEEVVDGDLIQQWLAIDRDHLKVTIVPDAVREYVDSLSKEHDTFGKERTFQTTEGEEIVLKPGFYGWKVNRGKETEKLIKLIRSGWQGSREPVYQYMAAATGEDDIGDSYVEINLTAQHLYLYVEGELVTESDFVSGNVSRGFDTPEGVYGLTYKTLDATLRGQGYATPVNYWMPFNGNVGMHDATWRREFGGKIYLHNGSHGCINLPREKAEKIYEYVEKGFPVICYKTKPDQYTGSHSTAPAQSTDEGTVDETGGAEGNGIGIPGQDGTGLPVIDPSQLPVAPGTEVLPPAPAEGGVQPAAPAPAGDGSQAPVPGDAGILPEGGVGAVTTGESGASEGNQ